MTAVQPGHHHPREFKPHRPPAAAGQPRKKTADSILHSLPKSELEVRSRPEVEFEQMTNRPRAERDRQCSSRED
jgi:hypothetical protein